MTNQQKGILLIGLLFGWGGLLAFQLSDNPSSTAENATQTEDPLPSIPALTLSKTFFNPRQTVSFSEPRNVFAPLGWVKPSSSRNPVPTLSTPTTKPTLSPSPQPTVPSPEELAAQRARQQLNQFRFLGYLTRGGESQAFLTNGQAIYIVKQGEVVEGGVHVNKIEPDTIVLSTQIMETGALVKASIPLTSESQG